MKLTSDETGLLRYEAAKRRVEQIYEELRAGGRQKEPWQLHDWMIDW